MAAATDMKLFHSIRIGNLHLSHRIVLAPMERFRSNSAHIPQDMMVKYYAQRASVPGTLLITEATLVSPAGGGLDYAAGIWSDEQVEAWKRVVDAVHAQGSFIFMQLVHMGRAADPEILGRRHSPSNPGGPFKVVAPSPIPLSSPERQGYVPCKLSENDISQVVDEFKQAAHNAVHRSGFDGVEIHGAHGYLVDQFLQDVSNDRKDEWGGSIENRSKFPLTVVEALVEEVGAERTAIRLSPFSTFNSMHMKDPQPTFAYFVSQLREMYPRFAYLHVTEPRVAGTGDRDATNNESTDFLREIWKTPDSEANGSMYISAGGYALQNALDDAERGNLIAFGRYYTSNPDLPVRLKKRINLTPYKRSGFYAVGQERDYVDYTFADKEVADKYDHWFREVFVNSS